MLSITPPAPAVTRSLHVRELRRTTAERVIGPYALSLHSGECVVVSGPSGVGKSLLLRMIADLDPNQGELSITTSTVGTPMTTHARAAMSAPAWRKQVTYVAAESGWWADTLSDHLHIASHAQALTLLASLGLASDLMQAPIARLSSGERQRCALLRAIVQQPHFLLLDEPSSALDGDSALRLEAVLHSLKNNGTGLLVVSHNAAQISRIADRVLYMSSTALLESPA